MEEKIKEIADKLWEAYNGSIDVICKEDFEKALTDFQSSQDKKIEKLIEKYKLKNDILIFIIDSNFNNQWLHEVSITFREVIDDLKQLI